MQSCVNVSQVPTRWDLSEAHLVENAVGAFIQVFRPSEFKPPPHPAPPGGFDAKEIYSLH